MVGFPKLVDPPPGKSGLVRDLKLRTILRDLISQRLQALGINRTADNFTDTDMKQIIKAGPLTMPSGVPIKRVVLLRTMNDPVVVPRREWDDASRQWKRLDPKEQKHAYRPRLPRRQQPPH